MLNLIISVISTFISIVIATISYIKGPLLVGILVGVAVLSFASGAQASVVNDCGIALSCTYPGVDSLWGAFSFSQKFAFIMLILALISAALLMWSDSKATKVQKSVFQVELDAAIKASLSKGNK